MSIISVSLPSDGTTADVGDYNTPINTIVNTINGGLDNSNIASGAAIAGSKLATASVTSAQINFGGAGAGVWWEEIGRTTLTSTGTTISVTSLPARKYLTLIWTLLTSGGTLNPSITYNNDTAANYSSRLSANGGADTTSVNATANYLDTDGAANDLFYGTMEIINIATQPKISVSQATRAAGTTAGTAPLRREQVQKWINTSVQISRVDIIAGGTLAIGSELVIIGHN